MATAIRLSSEKTLTGAAGRQSTTASGLMASTLHPGQQSIRTPGPQDREPPLASFRIVGDHRWIWRLTGGFYPTSDQQLMSWRKTWAVVMGDGTSCAASVRFI